MQSVRVIQRSVDQAYYDDLLTQGVDSVLAKIMAARPKHAHKVPTASLQPKLQYLDNPALMKDMDLATERLVRAIKDQEIIGVETDHDCDGQTSHAVIFSALVDVFQFPKDNIRSYIGHRMKEGYGLSESVAQRILEDDPKPTLVITADNGSADEPRIAKLKAAGIDVIVTDHHELGLDGAPQSAIACLNPTRDDCDFPDACIAGCMVAWLLMASTRAALIDQNLLDASAASMTSLLDYVAVGTVADCVSMARSINNRAVVQYGLKRITQGVRPCWQAVLPLIKKPTVQSVDLGFVIGPMLNSDGRLSDAFGSVNFLLSQTNEEATPWARSLYQQNQSRKSIQKTMTDEAMTLARAQAQAGKYSIVVFLADGHAGIHGISASRLKDAFGRPVIIFSPKLGEDDVITGSARSIDSLHIKEVMDQVKSEIPDVIIKYGGHKGAAGISIVKKGFETFCEHFENAVEQVVNKADIGPIVMTDGVLDAAHLTLDFFDQLQQLEPFGREFEAPIFEIEAQVSSARAVGDGTHLQLTLQLASGELINGIYFGGAVDCDIEALLGQSVSAVAELAENFYRGRKLQLMVKQLSVGEDANI